MNLLAHAYLSFQDPQILLGNMLGDDVKGKQINLYPPRIRTGIQLHRYIDSFTDQHPLLRPAKGLYRPYARLYAGPLLDITLDYFLANDKAKTQALPWEDFAAWAYDAMDQQKDWHTGGFKRYFPYLKRENWFVQYADDQFIEEAMANLLKRVGHQAAIAPVIRTFRSNREVLSEGYRHFFPELEKYVLQRADELFNQPDKENV